MVDMKTRRSMWCLPEEVTLNILIRLPLKSIGRCRCVCKLWRSLMSTPYFANLQLNRTISDPNTNNFRLLTLHPFYSLDYESPCLFEDVDDDSAIVNLDYPLMKVSENVQIVGSCNGLICLLYAPDCFILWNPLTKDARELPKLSTTSSEFSFSGLGHVSHTDDYKVVYANDTKLEVFSLKRGSWRRIDGPGNYTVIREIGTFVNGALHWVGIRGTGENKHHVIVSFNLAEEKFGEILMPVLHRAHLFYRLVIFEGSLCFISFQSGEFEVWVMKTCGMRMAWTPLLLLSAEELGHADPICFTKNGDFILDDDRLNLVRCNLKERTVRDLKNPSGSWFGWVVYVESLVAPAVGQNRMDQ
ncbi:hypothetical protein NMG60_11031825 [Bertholletia excelsa]